MYYDVLDRDSYKWRNAAPSRGYERDDSDDAVASLDELEEQRGPVRPIESSSLIQDEEIALPLDAAGRKAVATLASALGALWEGSGGADRGHDGSALRRLTAADEYDEDREAVTQLAVWGRDLLYGPVLRISARSHEALVRSIGALRDDPTVAYEIGSTVGRVLKGVMSMRPDGYSSVMDEWTDSEVGQLVRNWLDG